MTSLIRHDLILGSRRPTNYFWALTLFLGGTGFLLTGLVSYFKLDIPYIKTGFINFIPQGITMTFYGFVGFLLSGFLLTQIIFNVGSGYNLYDQKTQRIEIFRIGFPLKQKEIYAGYSFKDVEAVLLRIEEGLSPKREIYLRLQNNRRIPLTSIGDPQPLSVIEEEAIELANFLNVPLEDW